MPAILIWLGMVINYQVFYNIRVDATSIYCYPFHVELISNNLESPYNFKFMKKHILILGGSTFMGKELLATLSKEDYEIYYINRGKSYWNNEVKLIPDIHYFYGNREDTKDFTLVLRYLTKKLNVIWHAVIDFSCYKYTHLKSVYDALRGICGIYIFISTDSIYDVCLPTHSPVTEDQAIRDKNQKEKHKKYENYGHNKLKCEEFLTTLPDFPYVVLRLPDVIGPYDDSSRFFALIKWIQRNQQHPIEIDQSVQTQKMSLVYSSDVVKVIQLIIREQSKRFHKQIFNLCFDEVLTYRELIDILLPYVTPGMSANCKNVDKAGSFYPSVVCGPISNQKIKQLGITFTPLNEALKETVSFFLEKAPHYQNENQNAEEKLNKKME